MKQSACAKMAPSPEATWLVVAPGLLLRALLPSAAQPSLAWKARGV
jgi:hypothetical protein